MDQRHLHSDKSHHKKQASREQPKSVPRSSSKKLSFLNMRKKLLLSFSTSQRRKISEGIRTRLEKHFPQLETKNLFSII